MGNLQPFAPSPLESAFLEQSVEVKKVNTNDWKTSSRSECWLAAVPYVNRWILTGCLCV